MGEEGRGRTKDGRGTREDRILGQRGSRISGKKKREDGHVGQFVALIELRFW